MQKESETLTVKRVKYVPISKSSHSLNQKFTAIGQELVPPKPESVLGKRARYVPLREGQPPLNQKFSAIGQEMLPPNSGRETPKIMAYTPMSDVHPPLNHSFSAKGNGGLPTEPLSESRKRSKYSPIRRDRHSLNDKFAAIGQDIFTSQPPGAPRKRVYKKIRTSKLTTEAKFESLFKDFSRFSKRIDRAIDGTRPPHMSRGFGGYGYYGSSSRTMPERRYNPIRPVENDWKRPVGDKISGMIKAYDKYIDYIQYDQGENPELDAFYNIQNPGSAPSAPETVPVVNNEGPTLIILESDGEEKKDQRKKKHKKDRSKDKEKGKEKKEKERDKERKKEKKEKKDKAAKVRELDDLDDRKEDAPEMKESEVHLDERYLPGKPESRDFAKTQGLADGLRDSVGSKGSSVVSRQAENVTRDNSQKKSDHHGNHLEWNPSSPNRSDKHTKLDLPKNPKVIDSMLRRAEHQRMKFVQDMARVKSGDKGLSTNSQNQQRKSHVHQSAQFVVSKSGNLEPVRAVDESMDKNPDYYVYEYERARIEREQKLKSFLVNKQKEHIRKMAERRDKEEIRRKVVLSHQSLWDPKNLSHMGPQNEVVEDRTAVIDRKRYIVVGTEIPKEIDGQALHFEGKSCDQYYREKHMQEFFKSNPQREGNYLGQSNLQASTQSHNSSVVAQIKPDKPAAAFRIQRTIFPAKSQERRQKGAINLSVGPVSSSTIAEPTVVKYNKMNEGSELVQDKYRYFDQNKQGVQFITPVQSNANPNKSLLLDKSASAKQLPKLNSSISMKQYSKLPTREVAGKGDSASMKTMNLAAKGQRLLLS